MGRWRARVEDVLACVIVLLRPALVPACLRWATPRDGPWAPGACRPGTRHIERRGTKTRPKASRNVRRHSASEWECSRPPRAALPEGTLERICKPADGDTNGSTPATNWSPIWRSRRMRCQPASGPTRPVPPPRAPLRLSASCDAAPRKGARHINHPHVPYGKVMRAAGHEPKARTRLASPPREPDSPEHDAPSDQL